jgi:uncharacterized membrane protein YedE/YeeE
MLSIFEKFIIDVEMKAGDVQELNTEIRTVAEIAQGGSSRAVGDYMLNRYKQLAEVRNSPGRGAETNLPFWKLVAAGVIFGVGFVLIASCYNGWWSCSRRMRRTYEWIIAMAAIVLGAC